MTKRRGSKRRGRPKQTAQVIYLVNRKAEVVSTKVDNPFFNRAHSESSGNRAIEDALLNVRESPCRWYEARNWIAKDQSAAADKFRSLYERAGGKSVQAMDTTKEPVDGGFMSDGLTDSRMDAAKELMRAREKLGPAGYELAEQVCGRLIWIKDMSRNTYESRQMMNRLRDTLDTLSIFWGMRTRLRKSRAQRLTGQH